MQDDPTHFHGLHIDAQTPPTRRLTRKAAHDALSTVYSGYGSEPENPGYNTDDGYETELEIQSPQAMP